MTTTADLERYSGSSDSDHLGINYDPSHFIWQMIDYIRPLYEFKDKSSMSTKAISRSKDKLNPGGTMASAGISMSPGRSRT